MPASNAAAERMERRESFMVVSSWVLIGAVRRPSLTETRHDRSECLGANGDSALHQSHHTTARTRLACCVHQPNSLRLRTTDRNTQKLAGTRCHCLLRIVGSGKRPVFKESEVLGVSDASEYANASGLRARPFQARPTQPHTPRDKTHFRGRKRWSARAGRSTVRTRVARPSECYRSLSTANAPSTAGHLQKLAPRTKSPLHCEAESRCERSDLTRCDYLRSDLPAGRGKGRPPR